MKRYTVKQDSSDMVAQFLAQGGTVTKCKPQAKSKPKAEVAANEVEIEVEHLPPELAKKYFPEEN